MKTNLLNRFAGLCLALILTAGSAVLSNNPNGKSRNSEVVQQTCIHSISGLSEYQKERIVAMETENQTVMNKLRQKQRSTTEKDQKREIKKQIDKQAETHRNAVLSLLSADQQAQFLQFQTYGGNPNNQGQKQGMGKGNRQGKGSGGGRENGGNCRM
jgi:hypothetical protein